MANFPGGPIDASPATHNVVRLEIDAITRQAWLQPPLISGRRYMQPFVNVSTNQFANATIYVSWFALPMGTSITAIRYNITTAGSTGAVARVVAYDHGLTTGDPAALLYQSASPISTETTGIKEDTSITGLSVAGADGIWVGLIPQGGPSTLAIFSGFTQGLPGPTFVSTTSFTASQPGLASSAATFTGSAPDPCPAVVLSGAVPKMQLMIG